MRQGHINIHQTEPQLIGCNQKGVLLPVMEEESLSCGFVPYIPYTPLHPSLRVLVLCPSQWHIPSLPQVPEHQLLTATSLLLLPFLSLVLSLFPLNYAEFLPKILEQPPVSSPQLELLHEKINLGTFSLDSQWSSWRLNAFTVPSYVFETGKWVWKELEETRNNRIIKSISVP